MTKICIAGGSGFVGRKLISQILETTSYDIIALTRGERDSEPRLTWKKCDLFSRDEVEKALIGVDKIIYLVHSMETSARLDQSNFSDYDIILADNLGRGAKANNIDEVIYLGGIIPSSNEPLSGHLQSRIEVESIFKEHFKRTICLRAGLILGAGGSSFEILNNLVKRLPILVCPKWGESKISPIYINQVIDSFMYILDKDKNSLSHEVINLTSSDEITYLELLKKTAFYLKKKRIFIRFNFPLLTISKFWIAFFSGASLRLVYPLLESLKHPMIVNNPNQGLDIKIYSIDESFQAIIKNYSTNVYIKKKKIHHPSFVRSVQRGNLPQNITAKDASHEYMIWLPRFLYPFIKVSVADDFIYFSFIHEIFKILILEREFAKESDIQNFHIRGGLLARKHNKGRLEFREVLGGTSIVMSIHDFYPALPWYIYRYTQAVFHLFVMTAFKKYLSRLGSKR